MRGYGLLLMLLCTWACDSSIMPDWEGFDLQGHRGCRGLMPENSIEGMKKALDLGVKTLELDVVVSGDGQLLVSHEPYFSEEICFDAQGARIHPEEQYELNLFQMTYEEIQAYDCGSKPHPRFPEQQKMKVHKPLLVDLIEAADHYALESNRPLPIYNIETKMSPYGDDRYHPRPEAFADILYSIIDQKDLKNRCTVQSFDPRSLVALHTIDSTLRTVLLLEGNSDPQQMLASLGFVPYGFSPDYQLLNSEMLQWAHDLGMKVVPWTVNDPLVAKQLIELGVDGLITDYPDRVGAPAVN